MRNYNSKGDLEGIIIQAIIHTQEGNVKELRWSEIRDAILSVMAFENTDPPPHFNVKITRILNRLVKKGLLLKHEKGHKNTSYSLNEENYDFSTMRPGISVFGVGTFKPGDTYLEFKKKLFNRMEKEFGFKKMYDELVRFTSKNYINSEFYSFK